MSTMTAQAKKKKSTKPSVTVPYFNLTRQIKQNRKAFDRQIQEVLDSGQFILSPKVEEFERAFAKYCGVPYAVGVASGTDALVIGIRALGIGKGDEVIVPSYTYSASVFGILHNHATPVFADIDSKTFNIDPQQIRKAVTRRTRAILPVHLYGQAAAMSSILSIAKEFNLKVIEDAAQAHGAAWQGQKTGSFGDVGCFSFYPTKNLGGFGDGGMITLQDQVLYKKVLTLRNLGHINFRDDHEEVGYTSRLDALQAGFLSVKLKLLDSFNQKRAKIADRYRRNLHGTPVVCPQAHPQAKHTYHLIVVRIPNGQRDLLQRFLAERGITTTIHYKTPVHRQPFYLKYSSQAWDLPVTESMSREILSLPLFPEMTLAEVDHVSRLIREFYGA